MTTATGHRTTDLMHLDTEARAARNLKTDDARAERDARIVKLAATHSTWELARVTQLSESTIRAIRRGGRPLSPYLTAYPVRTQAMTTPELDAEEARLGGRTDLDRVDRMRLDFVRGELAARAAFPHLTD